MPVVLAVASAAHGRVALHGPCAELRARPGAHRTRCGAGCGQGIDLTAGNAVESDPAFLDLLATLDPKKDFIDFEVAPDSFDTFFLAKRLFVDRGFEYGVSVNTQPLPEYRDLVVPGQPRGL